MYESKWKWSLLDPLFPVYKEEVRVGVMGLDLRRELLKLLREDEEFRLAVAGLLGLDEILRELRRLREDFNIFVKEQARRWEGNERRWEEADKRFEAILGELKSLREELKALRGDHNRLREDFNTFVKEQARRWEEADKRFKWLISALAEIRESLGGAFEYYTANVVKAILVERGFQCDVRVNVVIPVEGFREVDILCFDPLVVGEVTISLRTVEEAEQEINKLLSSVNAVEKFTGRRVYLKVLAVESVPTNVVEYLRRRAKELDVYLITSRGY